MSTTLRERVLAGERLTGALVRMPCEETCEMLAVTGLDFLLVDCEHGPADVLALRHHIALADAHGVPVLVRPAEDEPALALRALDQGAQGIVAPHVESAEQARELVRALHYPPRGTRGFATYPRGGRFGTRAPAEHREWVERSTLVVAMLESPHAVADAAAITGVDGIDAYLVGTSDLGASRTDADPALPELLATAHGNAAAGVARADLAGSPDAARAAFDGGAQLIVYNVTQVMMTAFAALKVSP